MVREQQQCETEWEASEVSLGCCDDTELILELKDCDQVNIS